MFRRSLVLLIFSILLTGCDSQLVNKSLGCTEIIIVRIHQFNPEKGKGVMLFEGEQLEHGMLRARSHLPGLPSVKTTLKNGRYFHVLPIDSNIIQNYVGKNTIPVCWFQDNRFQNAHFYIRIAGE